MRVWFRVTEQVDTWNHLFHITEDTSWLYTCTACSAWQEESERHECSQFFFNLKYVFSCIECLSEGRLCRYVQKLKRLKLMCVALAVTLYSCSRFTGLADALKEEAFLCCNKLASPTWLQRKWNNFFQICESFLCIKNKIKIVKSVDILSTSVLHFLDLCVYLSA